MSRCNTGVFALCRIYITMLTIFQIRDGIVGTGQESTSLVFRVFPDTVSRWRQTIQHPYSILHPCLHGHYARRIRTSSSRCVLGQ